MAYVATSLHKNPCSGRHEIYIFGRPLHFLTQNYLPFRVGSWNIQFLVHLPYICYLANLDLDWLSSSWEEDVNAWRTTNYDGQQPIAIGQLSDSNDLKMSVLNEGIFKISRMSIMLIFFSSPELNTLVSFSDQNLFIVRRRRCSWRKLVTISSSSPEPLG